LARKRSAKDLESMPAHSKSSASLVQLLLKKLKKLTM
jgi:hypothetical protein